MWKCNEIDGFPWTWFTHAGFSTWYFLRFLERTHTHIYTVYIYVYTYIHTYIYISHIPFFSGFSIYFPWDPIMIPSHDDPMKSSVGSQGGSLPLPRWGIGSSPEPRSEGAAVPWRVTRVTRVTTQKRNDEETSSTSKLSLVVLLVDFYQVQFWWPELFQNFRAVFFQPRLISWDYDGILPKLGNITIQQ